MRNHTAHFSIDPADKSFFQNFYSEYRDFMYYIAQKYVPSQTDCEDLVQDTILRLMGRISICAFDYCSGLKELWFSGDLPDIGEYAFRGVTATAKEVFSMK